MFKKLSKSIREYKKQTILAPIFVMFEVLMEVLIPYCITLLVNNGINNSDIVYTAKVGVLLCLLASVALTFGLLAAKTAAEASTGFAKNLRKDVYYNIQGFAFSNIDKFSSSSIVTRLTTDITNVQNSFQSLIRAAIKAPMMLISSFFMAFTINSKLSMIFLVTIVFLFTMFMCIIRVAIPYFKTIFKKYDKLNSAVQENLRGIRVVKAFVRDEKEREKFEKASDDIYSNFIVSERLIALASPLVSLSINASLLALYWFGTQFVVDGSAQTGDIMALTTYASQMLMSIMILSTVLVMLMMSRASASRIAEILDEETDLKDNENSNITVKNGDIEFQNVFFSYTKDKNKCCLTDISLKINSGETVGIIGATGSSKSTLVQLIPRLYDVFSGTIKVGGEDIKDYSLEHLRKEVSVVLQKNTLFSGTIKENMRWGDRNATDEEIEEVCRLACADEFIQNFEKKYDTFIEQDGSNVSGGQRQRLCIARALLKKPKILILDDSTSAVDTKTDATIREAFKTKIPETTKIIIAQRISSIQFADKIIVMNGGKVDAVATHDELLKINDIYREIYELQVKGGGKDE